MPQISFLGCFMNYELKETVLVCSTCPYIPHLGCLPPDVFSHLDHQQMGAFSHSFQGWSPLPLASQSTFLVLSKKQGGLHRTWVDEEGREYEQSWRWQRAPQVVELWVNATVYKRTSGEGGSATNGSPCPCRSSGSQISTQLPQLTVEMRLLCSVLSNGLASLRRKVLMVASQL